jgi:hypothetical protein
MFFSNFLISSKFAFYLEFLVILENYCLHMLSIRGNNFIAHWTYEETISSHTEHTRNECPCSASGKMWTVFTCKFMLSICGTNFIAHWAYMEQILSLAEHMRNGFHRWLSIRGNVKSWKSRVTGPWDINKTAMQVFWLFTFLIMSFWCGPGQNRVTWKTPSRVAFVPLQEPVALLASYFPHKQMPVWSNTSVVINDARTKRPQPVFILSIKSSLNDFIPDIW